MKLSSSRRVCVALAAAVVGLLPLLTAPEASWAAPSWGAVETLVQSTYAVGPPENATLLTAPDGNQTAVWTRNDGSFNRVEASWRTVGGDWSASEFISPAGFHANLRDAVVAPNGAVTVVWTRQDGTYQQLESARRTPTGWGAPEGVSSETGHVTEAHASVDANGTVTAVWKVGTSLLRSKVSGTDPDGNLEWTGLATLASGAQITAWDALSYGDGKAVVVFDIFGTSIPLRATTRNADGTWATPTAVGSVMTPITYPHLAVDAAGTVTAVWTQGTDAANDWAIRSGSRPEGGDWSAVDTLHSEPTATALYVDDLVVDDAGAATTVWRSYFNASPSVYELWTAYRPAAGAWSAATHLTPGDSQTTVASTFAAPVSLAQDAAGNAALTWVDVLNGSEHIKAMTRDAGQAWSAPLSIAENPGPATGNFEDYNRPTVAVEDGEMALAYGRSTSSGFEHLMVTTRSAGGAWATPVSRAATLHALPDTIRVAVDDLGNITALMNVRVQAASQTHAIQSVSYADEGIVVDPDITPPVAEVTGPGTLIQLKPSFVVTWEATDEESGVASWDLRYERAPTGVDFYLNPIKWKTEITEREATWTATINADGTTCFEARARDVAGNVGAWSEPRCTVRPFPATSWANSLRTGVWSNKTGVSGSFINQYVQSSLAGSTLKSPDTTFKRLGIVVTKCPSCGKVEVKAGSTSYGVFTLQSDTVQKRKYIAVKTFANRRTATIRLIVRGDKQVRIEGMVASLR